jgi:predicted nucleic-acid-binding Zn-ribbon protein
MAEAIACAKCKSEKVVPKVRIMDRGHYSGDAGNLTLVIYENPEAFLFKGSHEGTLYAQVCGDCGYTELYLDDPSKIYDIYESQQEKEP